GTQYGDIFPVAYKGASTTALCGSDYLRTEDGKVICDANGYPQIDPRKMILIGNREPLFMSGLNTTVKYKGWTLSALFEGRLGGNVVNMTGRGLWSSGMHPALEHYRGRQVVWDGVVQTGVDANGNPIYEQNTTPIVLDATTISERYMVSSNFLEDGSYIRLQYVTLGYDFSSLLKRVKGIEGIKLSFTGNNLFLITRYTGSDPQVNASVGASGTGSAGIDNYAVPSTRSYNVSFQLTF
ncbi:MAG: SusC/RagA family TonB-linked outer membrane protein, partial [Paludibacteraceae bacterium]|nr:SusC/RagA family TonB-linked outer membrane protein [Paludibacteraceae bacterium]